jgi:hypothetical protein
VPTLVDMDIMAAPVTTDAMGGFAMHIPNADYEDREIKRGTRLEVIRKLITDNVNRTVPYQYRS